MLKGIDGAWDSENKESLDFWNNEIASMQKVSCMDKITKNQEPVNMVDHPSHYTHSSIEAIDAIEAALGWEGTKAAHTANVLKYMWRWQHKNGLQDLKKAQWYLNRLITKFEEMERDR